MKSWWALKKGGGLFIHSTVTSHWHYQKQSFDQASMHIKELWFEYPRWKWHHQANNNYRHHCAECILFSGYLAQSGSGKKARLPKYWSDFYPTDVFSHCWRLNKLLSIILMPSWFTGCKKNPRIYAMLFLFMYILEPCRHSLSPLLNCWWK